LRSSRQASDYRVLQNPGSRPSPPRLCRIRLRTLWVCRRYLSTIRETVCSVLLPIIPSFSSSIPDLRSFIPYYANPLLIHFEMATATNQPTKNEYPKSMLTEVRQRATSVTFASHMHDRAEHARSHPLVSIFDAQPLSRYHFKSEIAGNGCPRLYSSTKRQAIITSLSFLAYENPPEGFFIDLYCLFR
jgi:hypothetical protein